jgi:hypothetical protein
LEFITRATSERQIEVYNERLDRWEEEKLMAIVATVPGRLELEVGFIHEGKLTVADRMRGQVVEVRDGSRWRAFTISSKRDTIWSAVT